MSYPLQLLILCPLIFFAGFVDSIAGGGGLISIPAYYATGLPPHMVLGSNKFSAGVGCSMSTARFIKSGNIHLASVLPCALLSLLGSAIGARLTLLFSENALRYVLVICLPILAVFLMLRKDFTETDGSRLLTGLRLFLACSVIGFAMGVYDGFFGPGTGTFLILLLISVVGLRLLPSMGNAKVVNLSTNLASLAVFLYHGKVDFRLALPAAACSVLGCYIGSGLALKNGKRIVRPMMLVVLALLLVKILWDLFR